MSSPVPMLTSSLLLEFEDRLRAQGAPVVSLMRRGLSAQEMEGLLAPIGLHLPVEGRIWWGWHDGARRDRHDSQLGPGKEFPALSEAVRHHQQYRRFALDAADPTLPAPLGDPDAIWAPSWLRISGDLKLPIVIDCAVPEEAPSPIRMTAADDIEGSLKIRARSLGELIGWWIEALDDRIWSWNRGRGAWDYNWRSMTRERIARSVI